VRCVLLVVSGLGLVCDSCSLFCCVSLFVLYCFDLEPQRLGVVSPGRVVSVPPVTVPERGGLDGRAPVFLCFFLCLCFMLQFF